MKTAQYIPGPYFVQEDDAQCYRVKSEIYGTVAVLHDPLAEELGRVEELRATANLLAAAPNLLKACEQGRFIARAYRSMCLRYTKGLPDGLNESINVMESAITEATR